MKFSISWINNKIVNIFFMIMKNLGVIKILEILFIYKQKDVGKTRFQNGLFL